MNNPIIFKINSLISVISRSFGHSWPCVLPSLASIGAWILSAVAILAACVLPLVLLWLVLWLGYDAGMTM